MTSSSQERINVSMTAGTLTLQSPPSSARTKILLELVVLWTAFGYFIVRAFCNSNGIPLPPDVGAESYVHESYTLVVATLFGLFNSPFFPIF